MKKRSNHKPEKRTEPTPPSLSQDEIVIRLNKYVAKSGLASRRKAADMIKRGLIHVNGKIEINPAYRLQKNDRVTYKGKVLIPEETFVYILMNKPKNVITTSSDEKGRKTVLDLIKRVEERVYPVGRLDRYTTGLLLLTNDGDLAQKLSHPSKQVKKIYHVFLDKEVSKSDLEKIRKGIMLEDGMAVVDAVSHIQNKSHTEVGLELHSGKNRVVRRIFETLGYQVERLDRTYYAGLTKKDLPRGRHRHLTKREVVMLKHFI